jgi:catechol 2,3-dioxygenase-like lactoylglutathione lyase family enzyme
MPASPLSNLEICQVAVVVRDIARAAGTYAEVFGVPVPEIRVTDPESRARTRYLGKPTQARAKLAFLPMGSVTIELIEPVGKPSVWHRFLEEHGEGVHHIAFRVKGMDKVLSFLADRDIPAVQTGEFTGGRYAYVDSIARLGVILELLEEVPQGNRARDELM